MKKVKQIIMLLLVLGLPSKGHSVANAFTGLGSVEEQIFRAEDHLSGFERSINSSRANLQLRSFDFTQIGVIEGLYNESIKKNIVKPLKNIENQLVQHLREGFVRNVESDSSMQACMRKQLGWRDFKRTTESTISRVKKTIRRAESTQSHQPNSSRYLSEYGSVEGNIINYLESGDAALELEECCEKSKKTEGVCQADYQDYLALNVLEPIQMLSVPENVIDYMSSYRSGLNLTPEEIVAFASHSHFSAALKNAQTIEEERSVWLQAQSHCQLKTQEFMSKVERQLNKEDNIFSVVNFLHCADYGTGYWGGAKMRNAKIGFSNGVIPMSFGNRTRHSQCTEQEKVAIAMTNTVTPELIRQEMQLDLLAHPPWLQNMAYSPPVAAPLRFVNAPDGGLDIFMMDPQGRQRNYISLPGKETAVNAFLPNLPISNGGGVIAGGQSVFTRDNPSARSSRIDQSSGRRSRPRSARENHQMIVANTRRSRDPQGNSRIVNTRTSRAIASVEEKTPKMGRAISSVGSVPRKGRAMVQGAKTNRKIRKIASDLVKGDSPLKNARKLSSHVKQTRTLLQDVAKRSSAINSRTRSRVRSIAAYGLRKSVSQVQSRKVAALNAQSIADALAENTAASPPVQSINPERDASASVGNVAARDRGNASPQVTSIQNSNDEVQKQLADLRARNELKRKKIVATAKKMKRGIDTLQRKLNDVIRSKNNLIAERKAKIDLGAMVSILAPLPKNKWMAKVMQWRTEAETYDNELANKNTQEFSLKAEIETRMIALDNAMKFAINDLAGAQRMPAGPFLPSVRSADQLGDPNLTSNLLPPTPRNPQLNPSASSGNTQTVFFKLLDFFVSKAFAARELKTSLAYEKAWAASWQNYQEEFTAYLHRMQEEELEKKRELLDLYRKERDRILKHQGFVELDTQTLLEMNMANETILEEVNDVLEKKRAGELASSITEDVFASLRQTKAEALKVEELLNQEMMEYVKSFPVGYGSNDVVWRHLLPAVLLE